MYECEIVTNLDNYKDTLHFSEDINSYMLYKMKNKENLLTKENYLKKLNEIKEFYDNYNYEKILK